MYVRGAGVIFDCNAVNPADVVDILFDNLLSIILLHFTFFSCFFVFKNLFKYYTCFTYLSVERKVILYIIFSLCYVGHKRSMDKEDPSGPWGEVSHC